MTMLQLVGYGVHLAYEAGTWGAGAMVIFILIILAPWAKG